MKVNFLPTIAVLIGGIVIGIAGLVLAGPFAGFTLGGSVWSGGAAFLQSRTERSFARQFAGSGGGQGTPTEELVTVRRDGLASHTVFCHSCQGDVAHAYTAALGNRAADQHRQAHQQDPTS